MQLFLSSLPRIRYCRRRTTRSERVVGSVAVAVWVGDAYRRLASAVKTVFRARQVLPDLHLSECLLLRWTPRTNSFRAIVDRTAAKTLKVDNFDLFDVTNFIDERFAAKFHCILLTCA